MVRILIVEDQKIMQKYFEYIIMQEPEFRHVQTVSDAREAVKICDYSAIAGKGKERMRRQSLV
mgnify:CR=1 FL=1